MTRKIGINKKENNSLLFLSEGIKKLDEAFQKGSVNLIVQKVCRSFDKDYEFFAKVVDNVGGLLILDIPTYQMASECVGDRLKGTDSNRVVSARDSGQPDFFDSGCGFDPSIELYIPRIDVFDDPTPYIHPYGSTTDCLVGNVFGFLNWIKRLYKDGYSEKSRLFHERWKIEQIAFERNERAYEKEMKERDKLKRRNLVGKIF